MLADSVSLAAEERVEAQFDAELDQILSTLLAHYQEVTANPRSMGYLRSLLKHYAKDPHPWRACFTADTPIDCPRDHARFPDGVPISQVKLGDLVWSFNVEAYVFELKPITWASMTRRKAQLAMLTLDDGSQIKATPDHQFMRRDTTWVELQDLRPGDSLMPLYRDYLPMVRRNPDSLSWAPEHLLVANEKWPDRDRKLHVHHRDARRANTDPSNFDLLTNTEHAREHHRTVRKLLVASGIVRECRGCGERFEPSTRNQRLCGECPASAGYVRIAVGTDRECKHCGDVFVVRQPNQKFCSASCRNEAGDKPKRRVVCSGCGTEFKTRRAKASFCKDCRRVPTEQPMSDTRLCRNCGTEFMPSSGIQRHCSATCRKQYSQRKWNESPEGAMSFNHKVVSVVLLDERQDVWDIEVADNHSFVVRGVVAHNCYKDNLKRFGPKTAALCGVLKDSIRQSTHWRGHPALDHGSPGVAIAEADKSAAPPFGGHHGLKLDADIPIGPGDEVQRSSSDLTLVGPRGTVIRDHVAPDDGAIIHDIGWSDGTESEGVRETEIRRLSICIPDEIVALLSDLAENCDPCRVMLGLDPAPHPSDTFLARSAA